MIEPTNEEIEALRKDFQEKRLAAERAAYALFCALPVGRDRERASDVYENIRCATRVG